MRQPRYREVEMREPSLAKHMELGRIASWVSPFPCSKSSMSIFALGNDSQHIKE